MNFRRLLSISALAAFVFLAAGCASVNTVEPLYPQAKPDRVPDKRVITDLRLNDIASIVEVDHALSSTGLQRVQVKLTNTKAAVKNVNYRFQWFDAQGFALEDEPTQIIVIEGGDSRTVQDTAPSPNAVDWKLTLSESSAYTPGLAPSSSPTRR